MDPRMTFGMMPDMRGLGGLFNRPMDIQSLIAQGVDPFEAQQIVQQQGMPQLNDFGFQQGIPGQPQQLLPPPSGFVPPTIGNTGGGNNGIGIPVTAPPAEKSPFAPPLAPPLAPPSFGGGTPPLAPPIDKRGDFMSIDRIDDFVPPFELPVPSNDSDRFNPIPDEHQ